MHVCLSDLPSVSFKTKNKRCNVPEKKYVKIKISGVFDSFCHLGRIEFYKQLCYVRSMQHSSLGIGRNLTQRTYAWQPADILLCRTCTNQRHIRVTSKLLLHTPSATQTDRDILTFVPHSRPRPKTPRRVITPCVYFDRNISYSQNLTSALCAALFMHLRAPRRPLSLTEASNCIIALLLAKQHAYCAAIFFCGLTRADAPIGHAARYLGAAIVAYTVFRISSMLYLLTLVQEQRQHQDRYLVSSLMSLASAVGILHLLYAYADLHLEKYCAGVCVSAATVPA